MGATQPQAECDGKSAIWKKTPTPNLVRYVPKGTYYLRARFRGEAVRECLHTTVYRAACVKLGERMAELRASAVTERPTGLETLADALAVLRVAIANQPSLKSNTRRSYFEELDCLKPGKSAAVPPEALGKLTSAAMDEWWSRTASAYAAQRANHLLMFVRQALKIARRSGVIRHDPAEELKRLKVPRTRLTLLTKEQFGLLVASVRAQGKARSTEAANWLEFMAYSGLRPGEIAPMLWSHVDEARGVLTVYGGEENTKNREMRRVPIISSMGNLLGRMRDGNECVGRIFTLKRPREALKSACVRLKFPHQRIYDLRHLFASTCNEAGVDVPTFAKWLGHKDGGALAMRTYVHPHEEHEQRSALKVKF